MGRIVHRLRCPECRALGAEIDATRKLLRELGNVTPPETTTSSVTAMFRNWQPADSTLQMYSRNRVGKFMAWLDTQLAGLKTCWAGIAILGATGLLLGFRSPPNAAPMTDQTSCMRLEMLAAAVSIVAFSAFARHGGRPVCLGLYGLAAGTGVLLIELGMHAQSIGCLSLTDLALHVAGVFVGMFIGCVAGFALLRTHCLR